MTSRLLYQCMMSRKTFIMSVGYCALCNMAVNVIPWNVSLDCMDDEDPWPGMFSLRDINSVESFKQIRQSASCSLQLAVYTLPKSRKCKSAIFRLVQTIVVENVGLIEKCEFFNGARIHVSRVYSCKPFRSPYCALCSEYTSYGIEYLGCSPQPCLDLRTSRSRITLARSFSPTVVFDFDPTRGLAIGEHAPLDCDPWEIYHPEEGVCRAITCPTGLTLQGSTCVPEVSVFVFTLTGKIENTERNHTENVLEENKELLHSKLVLVINETLQENLLKQINFTFPPFSMSLARFLKQVSH